MITTEPADTTATEPRRGDGVRLRAIRPADADAVARIVYEAFGGIHDHHRFARDFPTLDAARGLAAGFIAHPRIWGVVAEIDGRVVGSNFLDERGPVRGVGPITVDPAVQARGVGRRLMEAVIERGSGARGIRLLQDAFNNRSLALYASLGFQIREPIAVMGGRPQSSAGAVVEVRGLRESDLEECETLHRRVHGFERTAELRDAIASPVLEPFVALRDGRVVGYTVGVTFFAAAHGVAETEQDLAELIAGALAATDAPASFLLPTRQGDLFRACLAAGLQVVKPMTYMTLGEYRDAAGAWFPSVLY
jgi:GNAT superfamily N-acetyltransferase